MLELPRRRSHDGSTQSAPQREILELNTQAMAMRETFRLNAVTLAHHGLIAPETVATFKGLVGYKNVGFDLVRLADLMRDSWSNIQGKTALTKQEVQNAKDLGERLVEAAGLREHSPAVQAEAAHVRQQALTLLLAAYDETRRAIGYLRWHKNDADTIAPSLYAGKTRQSTAAPTDQPEPSPNPTTPEPPAEPPVGNTPATPAPAGANGANGATTGLAAIAQGLPGASPYGA